MLHRARRDRAAHNVLARFVQYFDDQTVRRPGMVIETFDPHVIAAGNLLDCLQDRLPHREGRTDGHYRATDAIPSVSRLQLALTPVPLVAEQGDHVVQLVEDLDPTFVIIAVEGHSFLLTDRCQSAPLGGRISIDLRSVARAEQAPSSDGSALHGG